MTVASWYNRCALALLIVAILAYSTASQLPEFAVLAIPAEFALWRLSCRKAGRFLLPRFVVNILLFAVLAYAAVRAQGGSAVETIAQVVVLIQIIKIGDRRSPRDDSQILCLAVFLAIAAMLDSNELGTGLLLMLFLPLLVTTVMLFQLHKGAVNADSAAVEVGGGGAVPAVAASAAGFRRGLRATSGFATAGTLALALVVFVLLPRGVGEGVLGSFGAAKNGRETGFTSSVTLGGKGVISTSPTVVLDLTVKDGAGYNMGTAESVFYLRGAALTDYDNRKWTARQSGVSDMQMTPGEQSRTIVPFDGPMIEQSISMRASPGDRWVHLFALWRPVRVSYDRVGDLRFSASGILQRKGESGSFDYTVWSALNGEPVRGAAGPGVRTEPPLDAPALRDLAASILTKAGIEPDPAARPMDEDSRSARLIQDYLRTNYGYTLDQESPPAEVDPIEYFLFTRKKGHCEYFASAMVQLCKSVGINARMVTGYLATEFSSATGSYTVRESNAHAWVEAENADHRWQRFDPTPPGDLARIHRPSPGLFGRVRHALEAVEYAWNTSIVAFNERTRQNLIGDTRSDQVGWLGRVERASRRVHDGGSKLMLSALLWGVTVFAGVAAAGVLLSLAWARLPVHKRQGGARVRVRGGAAPSGLYRSLLRALSKRGMGKPAWRPPLEHAEALATIDGAMAEDVRRVVDAYYAQRFDGRSMDRTERGLARAAIRRIRAFRSARA